MDQWQRERTILTDGQTSFDSKKGTGARSTERHGPNSAGRGQYIAHQRSRAGDPVSHETDTWSRQTSLDHPDLATLIDPQRCIRAPLEKGTGRQHVRIPDDHLR